MSERNKDLARRWFEEVWNQGRESAIAELYHEQGKSVGFPESDSVIRGPQEFALVCRKFRNVFPDIHVTLNELVAEEDMVSVHWTATMTHLGDGLGIPASSKNTTLVGSTLMRFKDGKVIEGRNHLDFNGLLLKLK